MDQSEIIVGMTYKINIIKINKLSMHGGNL